MTIEPSTIPLPALVLLPNLLGEHKDHHSFLPGSVDKAVETLDGLIAESAPAGRRYLGRFKTKKPANQIPLATFNINTPETDIDFLLDPIKQGERWGYVSDCGLPCIADPGAKLVERARQRGLHVEAHIGPSSILLALMLSGLPGQRFAFHGYLERDAQSLKKTLQRLEHTSRTEKSTQIFMETPYRAPHLFEALLLNLASDTVLCVARDLTLSDEEILVMPIKAWKKFQKPDLVKHNAIFLLNA
jgi:16S rRNA (cytidine1402-2'-O)-methyltransferase